MTIKSPGECLGLVVTAVVAIFVPPCGFAVSFAQVIRHRHEPAVQRPWALVMALAWVGLVLWALLFSHS